MPRDVEELVLGGLMCAGLDAASNLHLMDEDDFPHMGDQFLEVRDSIREHGAVSMRLWDKYEGLMKKAEEAQFSSSLMPIWVGELKRHAYAHTSRVLGERLLDACKSGDTEVVEDCVRRLRDVPAPSGATQGNKTGEELLLAWQDMVSERDQFGRVPTGVRSLDRKLGGGLTYGELFLICARTGIGKSSFLYQMVVEVCIRSEIPAAFFSLEILKEEVVELVAKSNCSWDNNTPDDELTCNVGAVAMAPLWINDEVRTLEDLLSQARHLINKQGVRVIFLDYAQKLELKGRPTAQDYEKISAIASQLKTLTLDYKVIVVAAAQVNRGAAQTQGKDKDPGPPGLHQIKGSGALEQDANIVAMLHRPPYYDEFKEKDYPEEAYVYLRKCRRALPGKISVLWKGTCQRLEPWKEREVPGEGFDDHYQRHDN